MKPMRLSTLSCALALVFSPAALAQTPPGIGEALRQAQPPAVPAAPAPVLPAVGGLVEAPLTRLPGGPTVTVKAIEIVGNRVLDAAVLHSLVADAVGKALTLAELEALALRITRHYRAAGYFVARAYIPAQEISAGNLRIRVVEGNYGRFHLKNQSPVKDAIVQGLLDDIKDADIVSFDTLERAMLIINDTPGVRVTRADVMPGEQVGTSDFAVDTEAGPRRGGYVMADNHGSRYTGKNRLSFNADFNSPTGHGDRLSVSGMGSDDGGLLNGRIGYSTLLAANGLRGEIAASHTRYELGSTYASLDALGTATGIDAGLTWPLRRTRAQTVEVGLTAAYRDLRDEIRTDASDIPKTLWSLTGSLDLRDERPLFGLAGLTQANVAVTFGDLDIRDATARADDAAGARTDGSYGKLMLSLSRVSLLPHTLSLTTSLKAQHAFNDKNLDGSERMAVSGMGGVMAYPGGELIGDDAVWLRAELARPLPLPDKLKARAEGSLFADYGKAAASHDVGDPSRRDIADIGLGLNLRWQEGALLRLILAHRLGDDAPTSEPWSRNKLLVQAGWVF